MAGCNRSLNLYKELHSVLRALINQSNTVSGYRNTYGYSYISLLYGNSKNLCQDEATTKHLQFLADTYLCLLKSIRACKLLYDRYKGGEDSVEKIAERIGFKLPPSISDD